MPPIAPNAAVQYNQKDSGPAIDVSKWVHCPNAVLALMVFACVAFMAMAVYQGDRGSWKQLERLKRRREEARNQRMTKGMNIVIPSHPTNERTPLLLVVPPPSTPDFQKGLASPALSGVTEIPTLQEGLPDLEPRKGGESSSAQQRRFSY
ncbi:hypothetical protein QBC43DRAFT_369665 [Cladorrhinum sp. PSN259]|nr:hypothetical protein QBC43DRAFT_369665 [Cladorrhinum sp. PSN259]